MADLKSLGADRLFPNLPASDSGKREKYLSRDFNEGLLKSVDLWQPRVKVFHSFRDTMNTRLAKLRLHPAHISDWMGHAREGTEAEHYIEKLTISTQVTSILPALDFGVDFAAFKYEAGRWNEYLKTHMVP